VRNLGIDRQRPWREVQPCETRPIVAGIAELSLVALFAFGRRRNAALPLNLSVFELRRLSFSTFAFKGTSRAMHPAFKNYVENLHPAFDKLVSMPPLHINDGLKNVPEQCIYLSAKVTNTCMLAARIISPTE
jgi:hypothetical protein